MPIKKHYIGEVINNITIIDKKLENKRTYYNCKCSCGKTFWTRSDTLKTIESCGCLRLEKIKSNAPKLIKKHLDKNIIDNTNISVIARNTPNTRNTSGHKGVRWDKERNTWYAFITFKGKFHFLGRYADKEEAIAVRKKAEEKYFKKFLDNLNKNY